MSDWTLAGRASAEALAKTLLAVSGEGVAVLDLDTGEHLHVGAALCELVGYGQDDLQRLRALDAYIPLDQRETVRAATSDLRRTGTGTYTIALRHKSGERIETTVRAAMLPDGRHAVLAFAPLDESQRALRAERDFTAALLQSANESAIITTDVDGVIRGFNAGAERLLGYRAADVVGVHTVELFHDPDEVAARGAAARSEPGDLAALSLAAAQTSEWTYIRADGGRLIVSLAVSAIAGDDGTPRGYVGVATDVTERRRLEEERATAMAELERISRTDALTRLPNRRALEEMLADLLGRAGARAGVLMIDIDRFKAVNDAHGHGAGDHALREVADRLRDALRERGGRSGDAVGRWGGEEFCVLLADAPTAQVLQGVSERLRRAVAAAPVVLVDGTCHSITVSVGAAGVATGDGTTADVLLDAADRALYAAKRAGRDRVRMACKVDGEQLDGYDGESLAVAQALALAASVREGQPELHCQQVADLSVAIARRMGLAEADVHRARLGGWLHDVGKVAIPDRVLAKPGPLTAEEWAVMRSHAVVGEALVHRVPTLRGAAAAVRHHHERWDGLGYPDALAGDAIPIEARVVAGADAYSAITSSRIYRIGREREIALAELRRSAGGHLDPAVVEALIGVLERARRPAA